MCHKLARVCIVIIIVDTHLRIKTSESSPCH